MLHDVILTVTGNLLIFTGDMRQNKKKDAEKTGLSSGGMQ